MRGADSLTLMDPSSAATIEISENTKIGLYAVIASVPVLAAAIFFIAAIYFKAEATEARVERQSDTIKEQRTMLIEIRERTARIEALLTTMSNKQ